MLCCIFSFVSVYLLQIICLYSFLFKLSLINMNWYWISMGLFAYNSLLEFPLSNSVKACADPFSHRPTDSTVILNPHTPSVVCSKVILGPASPVRRSFASVQFLSCLCRDSTIEHSGHQAGLVTTWEHRKVAKTSLQVYLQQDPCWSLHCTLVGCECRRAAGRFFPLRL